MKDEEIKKLIKIEDELCKLEERAEKGHELAEKSKPTLIYVGVIWLICAALLLFVINSPLIILLAVVVAVPVFLYIFGKLTELTTNNKLNRLKQSYQSKRKQIEEEDINKKKFEEEMAVYKK
jgi:Flp pilus assembly protein TadB